jgi:hypothetical protein
MYPEIRRFEAPQRRAAWRRANQEAGVRRLCWIGLPLLIGGATAVMLVSKGLPGLERDLLQLCSGVGVMAAVLGTAWIMRRSVRRSLRRQLRERGAPICVGCGYDLTALESQRCPECGWLVPEH